MSINLAISLAMELDKKVLLVDADVARPSVLERLGSDRSPGFSMCWPTLRTTCPNVLLRTNIDKLTLLPAGSRVASDRMLASDSDEPAAAEMAHRYPDRIIVFDAPPLLPSTESRVLATHMGQVILVVEAEHTPQKTVMQALATIESCPVVMPLLNKASHSEVGAYYGYYGPDGAIATRSAACARRRQRGRHAPGHRRLRSTAEPRQALLARASRPCSRLIGASRPTRWSHRSRRRFPARPGQATQLWARPIVARRHHPRRPAAHPLSGEGGQLRFSGFGRARRPRLPQQHAAETGCNPRRT